MDFLTPKIPQFTSINLTLKFKASTGNTPVQGKVGVESRVGKQEARLHLGSYSLYTHACMHTQTRTHVHTQT